MISRRTWRFFEKFVTADDRFLPPDNFQEDPKPVVAHRTSPTNIGLYLLSTLAARDLGWLGVQEAADRLEATLANLGSDGAIPRPFLQLVRHTSLCFRSIPNMSPRVDSGNLAGHLMALGNGCREIIQESIRRLTLARGSRRCD